MICCVHLAVIILKILLITPLERAAGLATDMHILLDDLFPSAPSRIKMTTSLPVFVLSSGPYHCRQPMFKTLLMMT